MPATRHPANLYPRTFANCCGKHLLSGGLSSLAPARARQGHGGTFLHRVIGSGDTTWCLFQLCAMQCRIRHFATCCCIAFRAH